MEKFDLAIIGGGVNGCGIARDAAGRGIKTYLCEMDDFGGGTSSASTKLIHGGLRYLEHFEFALVREALTERERLWSIAPHIIWPLRLILPHRKGLRPKWMLRAGLFLYDYIGGRKRLPTARTVNLSTDRTGAVLKDDYSTAFEFSDCWVQDNRLVVLNAIDAQRRGATVEKYQKAVDAKRVEGGWEVTLENVQTGSQKVIFAKALVNAAGPWVEQVFRSVTHQNTQAKVRMVKGSHIIVKKLFEHDKAYFFQNPDGRIFFAIPYEMDYTLIGTTDQDFEGDPRGIQISPEETTYLCDAVSAYFKKPVTPEDVVWSYAGVRPLYDDGASNASETTRDYVLKLRGEGEAAPILSIFGGKITTYRHLAEEVIEKLAARFPEWHQNAGWTGKEPLPGGAFGIDAIEATAEKLAQTYPFLSARHIERFMRHYGDASFDVLGDAKSNEDLGQWFGPDLSEKEVRYLQQHEWADKLDDIIWRRTKAGLSMNETDKAALEAFLAK